MPQLTVQQLFQPASSGVGPYGTVNGATVGYVPQVPGQGTWLSAMLQVAGQVQLPTTSWQSGGPERTIFAAEAVMFSLADANISVMAQGGFLQSASAGTVTYTAIDGTVVTVPVTPDPSNSAQNPTGAPGWLDLLANNVYDVERLSATYASGPLAIAKLTAGSLGPYPAGTYHVASISGATYANTQSLTIPSSIIAGSGGVITAVSSSISSSVITTSAAHGLATGQSVYVLIPTTSGINGLAGVFANVGAVTTYSFQIGVGSSGTYTGSGGNVYLCTVATMQADVAGVGSNAGPGTVTVTVTQNSNVFVSNVPGWSGSNWESNAHLVGRCQDSLAARSPNGPSQAYVYFAETAQQLLASETPSYQLTNGPVVASEFSTPGTGVVNVVVASATPNSTTLGGNVTPGCAQNPVTGVSLANPCVISCANATGMSVTSPTMTMTVSGVLGVTGPGIDVNGTWSASYVSANSFSIQLNTSTASAYAGGGQVEGGDLGQIDRLIQQNVVPDNTTAVTSSALALPITIVATVVVPQAYVAQYQVAVVTALQTQIASYAIGGNAPDFAVAYDDIVGALENAGILQLGQATYVRQIQSLSINGGGTGVGVAFPSLFHQAVLLPASITVLGV